MFSIYWSMIDNMNITNIHIKKSSLSNGDISCKLQSNKIIFLKAYYWCLYFLEILYLKSSQKIYISINVTDDMM